MRRGQNRGGRQKDEKREAGREGDDLAPQGSSPGPGPVFMFGGVHSSSDLQFVELPPNKLKQRNIVKEQLKHEDLFLKNQYPFLRNLLMEIKKKIKIEIDTVPEPRAPSEKSPDTTSAHRQEHRGWEPWLSHPQVTSGTSCHHPSISCLLVAEGSYVHLHLLHTK
jgi:hypothetical protein